MVDPISCSAWPTDQSYDCVGSSGWKYLDTTMSIYDTKSCQALCNIEGSNGCCYLGTGTGCYFKHGAQAKITANGTGLSVTCEGNTLWIDEDYIL